MGFRQATPDPKKLAEYLNIDEDKVVEALQSCSHYGYARIWAVENDNEKKYSNVRLTTSRTINLNDGSTQYITDFQDGYVKFFNHAFEKVKKLQIPQKGLPIRILCCNTDRIYNAEQQKARTYFNVTDFYVLDDNNKFDNKSANVQTKKPSKVNAKSKSVDDDDELPFN